MVRGAGVLGQLVALPLLPLPQGWQGLAFKHSYLATGFWLTPPNTVHISPPSRSPLALSSVKERYTLTSCGHQQLSAVLWTSRWLERGSESKSALGSGKRCVMLKQ